MASSLIRCARHLGQHVLVARVAGEPAQETGTGELPRQRRPSRDFGACRAGAVHSDNSVIDTLPADRLELMRSFVRERVVQVLRLDAAEPPERNERLMDLGFDSLMAVQLRNLLGKGLGIERPLSATLDVRLSDDRYAGGPSARSVGSAKSRRRLRLHGEPGPCKPAVLGMAAVAAMSDAEIEARLLDRLGER